ncbi:hypothetical protein [Paraclostridium bifermentans]|nr:hypothetical protein [Paraclostridium bifermentans]
MKITVEFKSVDGYLELKQKTVQNDQAQEQFSKSKIKKLYFQSKVLILKF